LSRKKMAVLATVAFMVLFSSSLMVSATDKELSPSPETEISITNNILTVWIESATGSDGVGTFTIETGSAHTNPDENVFYGGDEGDAWSTYTTIHVTDTTRDYVTTSDVSITPDTGFTLVNLDTQSPTIVTSTATRVVIQWTTIENLLVEQDIEVTGTTVADTFVRITTTVINNDEVAHTVGVRYEWDLTIAGEDGSYVRPWDTTPGSWLSVESEWTPPPFEYWETTNDPASPVFSVLGSVTSPTATPPPTPPDNLVFADWGSSYYVAHSYTPTGLTIAGPGADSAVLYYWDPVVLDPAESVSVTTYVWCLYISPTPTPVGGEILSVNKLQLTAPCLLILALAVAGTVGILFKKRI